MTDLEKARRDFQVAKNRAKRKDKIMADKLEHEKNKPVIDIVKKAAFIIGYMTRVDCRASQLEVVDILDKVRSEEELEFYYRWCCRPC